MIQIPNRRTEQRLPDDRLDARSFALQGNARRFALVVTALMLVIAGCFGGLWWRLSASPINFDLAAPWLAAAIEESTGNAHTVEIGRTQIEWTGQRRVVFLVHDVVVRDRGSAVIVASMPKAEIGLSGLALLTGRLRVESLNLFGAEMSIRVTPDGNVSATSGLLGGLDWFDRLSLNGLGGHELNQIGLSNGSLVVDGERGNRWTLDNINLALRKPSRGGVELSFSEEGVQPWSLAVWLGPQSDGARSVELRADKVPMVKVLRAMQVKDIAYSADLPVSGELKGKFGRDGLPVDFRGKLFAAAGHIIDGDAPDYPMAIDSAEMNVEWDAARRVLVAPFKITSGANRVTLLARLEPPNGNVAEWQANLSGGTIVLAGDEGEQPLIFNRIAVGMRFDTAKKRALLTQADISNGQISVAGTGLVDYSGETRLQFGVASTPMSASALKRIWPVLIVPELREWVVERIERGTLQRLDFAINAPLRNLSRRGPPIADDGLAFNITASGVTMRPVDDMPAVRDADLKARVTGRTATVTVGQGVANTPAGRSIKISDFTLSVPDTSRKSTPSRIRLKIDGPVPAAAEIIASDRFSGLMAPSIDPNGLKGTFTAVLDFGIPVNGEFTKENATFAVTADLDGFSADKFGTNQRLEAKALKIVANNRGYQVQGDVRIDGQPTSLDYRKPFDGDAILRPANFGEAHGVRLGFSPRPAP